MLTVIFLVIGLMALVLLTHSISAVLVLWGDFKYYKLVYETLPFRTYYAFEYAVYSHKFGEPDDGFMWFSDTDDFKLVDEIYLHNANFTYWSIYGWYWLRKYQKWFRENIDINSLPRW